MEFSEYYEEGLIEKRLARLVPDHGADAPDALQPYREAAAVLVFFDPVSLNPTRVESKRLPGGGLKLLPELVPAPPPFGEAGMWSLEPARKRAALRKLATRQSVLQALKCNLDRPDHPVQRVFEKVVRSDRRLTLADFTDDEFEAFATVAGWLSDILDNVPDPESISVGLANRRAVAALRHLADSNFRGRQEQLDLIEQYVGGDESEILFIYGAGGTGKSALLAKFLLEGGLRQRSAASSPEEEPWIRIDLDDPQADPRKPDSILRMAIHQLSSRFEGLERQSELINRELSDFSHSSHEVQLEAASSPMDVAQQAADELVRLIERVALRFDASARFVFVIDTFEEAQFFGKEVESRLLSLLGVIMDAQKAVRIVVCGRAAPRKIRRPSIDIHELPELSIKEGAELLQNLVKEAAASLAWDLDKNFYFEFVERLGRVPLTLRLAAPLVIKNGRALLDDLEIFAEFEASALQARLYSRILAHLHDDDAKKLSIPGLVVRRITPELIQEVLAKPCKLGEIDLSRATVLFRKLEKEVALVTEEPDGSLRHRTDVRRMMLLTMPPEMVEQIREIDRLAAEFWRRREGEIARSEEIYHRLRLGEAPARLDSLWSEGQGLHLGSAVDEFEPGSTARAWLAAKQGMTLDEPERTKMSPQDWERHAETAARRWLGSGRPEKVLEVINERGEPASDSPLNLLAIRAFMLAKNLQEARRLAEAGYELLKSRGRDADPELKLEFDLLLALVLERISNDSGVEGWWREADHILRSCVEWQNELGGGIQQVRAMVRWTGSRRRHRLEARPIELVRLVHHIDEHYWRLNPGIFRETLAEIGEQWTEGLQLAFGHSGREMLARMTREEVVQLLRRSGMAEGNFLFRIEGGREDELRQLASSLIGKALYSREAEIDGMVLDLVRILQRETDHLMLGGPSETAREKEADQRRGGYDSVRDSDRMEKSGFGPALRAELVDIIDHLPLHDIELIANYYLGRRLKVPSGEKLVRLAEQGQEWEALLRGIVQNTQVAAFAPTLREIARNMGLSSVLGQLKPQNQSSAGYEGESFATGD